MKHGLSPSRMEINWQLENCASQTRVTWFAVAFVGRNGSLGGRRWYLEGTSALDSILRIR